MKVLLEFILLGAWRDKVSHLCLTNVCVGRKPVSCHLNNAPR